MCTDCIGWLTSQILACCRITNELIRHNQQTDHTVPLAAALRSKNRFLFVGDSITCGFCDEDNIGGLTRGVADAYPSALKRLGCGALSVDVVAFPGITLVGKEGAFAAEAGMARKFWHVSAIVELFSSGIVDRQRLIIEGFTLDV